MLPAIAKVAIQMTPGTGSSSAKASLYLAPLPTGGQVLVYSPALQLGILGTMNRMEFRDQLRALFHLPKPPSEKSVGASINRLTTDVNKLGQSLFGTKLF